MVRLLLVVLFVNVYALMQRKQENSDTNYYVTWTYYCHACFLQIVVLLPVYK